MITLKSGVPGSGKTLSMVAELLEKHLAENKGQEPRPVYTNITGLAIPHIPLVNLEPTTKREPGVLYTTDWQQCPPGSLVIIDEAFLYGYDAKAGQASVPGYIRDLAIHRKDYSLDLWFIVQHPKLLHVALRRQVGKHQHYRRLFGWGTAVCYEWDQCQDNLSATKTAVVSRFKYPKSVFQAYKSAEIHTKPKFQKPWFIWIPVALIPLAAWAAPNAYQAMHGTMTGKGLTQLHQEQTKPKLVASLDNPGAFKPEPLPPGFLPPDSVATVPPGTVPLQPFQAPVPVVSGCIATKDRACKCYDTQGKVVPTVPDLCPSQEAKSATDLALVKETQFVQVQQVQMRPLSLGGTTPLQESR
jgi:zona occludens toxin